MIKCKIFFGSRDFEINRADYKLNKWLAENPNVRIVNMFYQQARMGDHSICITYEGEENDH